MGDNSHRFSDSAAVLSYLLAGNARITVVSQKTGNRFTFRARKPRDNSPHFVSVLTGSDNESSFSYLGTIFEGKNYAHGRKSRISPAAPSAQAFSWLWDILHNHHILPDKVEVWHEGRCGRCARVLTVPSSIASGIGPECARHAA